MIKLPSDCKTREDVENFVLSHTNEDLITLCTKADLVKLFQVFLGCAPRSGINKADLVAELRGSVKYRIRNHALASL